MTPLAARVAKELTLPKSRRSFVDHANILSKIEDVHCFEVTQVLEIARALAEELYTDEAPLLPFRGLAFLPAPKTWIEYRHQGERSAYLLTTYPNERRAKIDCVLGREFGSAYTSSIPLDGESDPGRQYNLNPAVYRPGGPKNIYEKGFFGVFEIYVLLSLINSPRRINQKVVQPHAGLMRKLARAHGGVGKYPLHAYRELTLKVGPPVDAKDEKAWVDYLNNRMPLHFVRAHRCRKAGVNDPRYDQNDYSTWDLMPAIWRGDPALGTKLTRYKLVA